MPQYINPQAVGGRYNQLNITAATVVKATAGRIVSVMVNTAGAAGAVYDANTTGGAAAANLVGAIPATASNGNPIVMNFPCMNGILVVPGAAQVVSVSYD